MEQASFQWRKQQHGRGVRGGSPGRYYHIESQSHSCLTSADGTLLLTSEIIRLNSQAQVGGPAVEKLASDKTL